jgi:FPC/CPF motif-containing protein YcgG
MIIHCSSSGILFPGLTGTFWVPKGMQTKIRDSTENFGEEISRAIRKRDRTTLKSKIHGDRGNWEF